jgi:EF hand
MALAAARQSIQFATIRAGDGDEAATIGVHFGRAPATAIDQGDSRMTNKLTMALGAAAAAALLGGGAALYADTGAHGPMAKFDSDGNGAISLAEARAGAAKMFAGADSDKDGRVTHAEMRAFHGKMGGHHRGPHGGGHAGGPPKGGGKRGPMHLDADGDGALTLAETQSGIERHFGELDSNRDGSITEAEMRSAHEARKR